MADDKNNVNLSQQRYLGASAAGVVGATVPGTPMSSSYEGLSEVCEAGTSAQLATAEVETSSLRGAVDQKDDSDPKPPEEYRSIDDILRDIDAKYARDSPPEGSLEPPLTPTGRFSSMTLLLLVMFRLVLREWRLRRRMFLTGRGKRMLLRLSILRVRMILLLRLRTFVEVTGGIN